MHQQLQKENPALPELHLTWPVCNLCYVVRASFYIRQGFGNIEWGVSGGVAKVSRELVGEKLSFPSYRLRISLESIKIRKLL